MRIVDRNDFDSQKKIRIALGIEDALIDLGYDSKFAHDWADIAAKELIEEINVNDALENTTRRLAARGTSCKQNFTQNIIDRLSNSIVVFLYNTVQKFTQLFEVF